MTYHVRDAGVWKEIIDPQVRDAGVWKPVQEGHVRDAGVWKKFYDRIVVVLTNRTVDAASVGTATAGIYFYNSGQLTEQVNSAYNDITGEWLTGGTPGNYSVRRTHVSGPGPTTGPAADTWHVLSTSRIWTLSSSSAYITNVSDYDIRRDSDSVILATARITLQVEGGAS